MRTTSFVVLAGFALTLGACGTAENQSQTTAQEPAATQTPATPAPGAPAAGAAMAAPITGTTHEVRMIGDERGYRYEPASITVRAGDGIRFINVSGFPHDVTFYADSIPSAGRAQLNANMPTPRAELTSPLFLQPNETYTISFTNVAPGRYPFHCTPHIAMGMRGEVTVQ